MPSDIRVNIYGAATSNVVRFEAVKAFGKHSMAVVDLAYPKAVAAAVSRPWIAPEWTPAEVTLRGSLWVGYVHHGGVVADVRDRAGAVVRYTLIGTSLPMNEQRNRAWKNCSASSIVRDIAREHRLRSVITPHRSIIKYYAQAGVSDWKVLQDMATRTGQRLWVDGSTVTFVNPSLLLEGVQALQVPNFSQDRVFGLRDTLYAFSSKAGTMVPRPGGPTSKQVVFGVDPRTGSPIKALGATSLGDGSPVGSSPVLTQIGGSRISSMAQAADHVAAQVTNTAGWITATAVVVASPEIVPGTIVNISGSKIPVDQTGRWIVTEVRHTYLADMSQSVDPYKTTLELERDRFYGPNITSATRTSNTRDSVPAKIRNGYLWEADYLETIDVG